MAWGWINFEWIFLFCWSTSLCHTQHHLLFWVRGWGPHQFYKRQLLRLSVCDNREYCQFASLPKMPMGLEPCGYCSTLGHKNKSPLLWRRTLIMKSPMVILTCEGNINTDTLLVELHTKCLGNSLKLFVIHTQFHGVNKVIFYVDLLALLSYYA